MNPGDLIRHALGVQSVNGRWKKPYRNHYVGTHEVWEDLVKRGLAELVTAGNAITGGEPAYCVTPAGKIFGLDGIEFKRTWGYGAPVNP